MAFLSANLSGACEAVLSGKGSVRWLYKAELRRSKARQVSKYLTAFKLRFGTIGPFEEAFPADRCQETTLRITLTHFLALHVELCSYCIFLWPNAQGIKTFCAARWVVEANTKRFRCSHAHKSCSPVQQRPGRSEHGCCAAGTVCGHCEDCKPFVLP